MNLKYNRNQNNVYFQNQPKSFNKSATFQANQTINKKYVRKESVENKSNKNNEVGGVNKQQTKKPILSYSVPKAVSFSRVLYFA